MRVAVVGAGIAGLSAAYYLSPRHQVEVFEANDYLGGHTDTHDIDYADKTYRIDTGFIVFNNQNYPNFSRLLNTLDVDSQPTTMSFSVSNMETGLEYNATDLNRLFCQRRNLVNPRFYRMLADIVRFYRRAPEMLTRDDESLTLAMYLKQHHYSDIFIEDHLLPMACALWSGPGRSIRDFPARYFIEFLHNHQMLNLWKRPQWRVVSGGSNSYVSQLIDRCDAVFHNNAAVNAIHRDETGVAIMVDGEQRRFDKVVIATHADQALRMLAKPSTDEAAVLGNIRFQQNEMLLHSDPSVLPKTTAAVASWNVRVAPELAQQCTVNYHMNTLQNLDAPVDFIVSLNSDHLVNPDTVFLRRRYFHPVYNQATLAAQKKWPLLAGKQHTYFCGAYWGWGFHEDGINSALRVVDAINQTVEWADNAR
ncbi:Amine oxidase [Methylophaga frappieri]|uniref:Amine oxidase n=1 Tax=Methylophaga frappieri (strain ATCC BAA-2434 / DSM 25690 / JAM7) TaxID=754477 RepID=I1YF22_METFJ|nr:FAD-dependent oxidoreductase [Methylophaga frappieri]AFJ01515.1 Amine oxidase [Methylophaga frappieri]